MSIYLLRETGGTATQTEGILERLRLAGMPEADIRRLIATQKNTDSLYAQSAH
ncbi:cation efflux system protein [Escherichia coli]|uniref:Cation efflux system protein n=1 Tax=Escherichia coli TaxID=562 RepID=A0A377DHK4_ECOLX|nr:cation efflux system protein [Escherichia coli]